jgi:hypothetical protein
MDIKRLLQAQCKKSIAEMVDTRTVSHSFNVFNQNNPKGYKACAMLLLFVPSHLDQEIYDALKPIFDREFGPGALVEPGKEAARVVRASTGV